MSVWFASPAEDQVIYCYFSRSNQKNDPIPKKWSRRNVNTGNESQIDDDDDDLLYAYASLS